VKEEKVPTRELVTATFPLVQAPEAFELARACDSVKVHLASS